MQMRDGVQALVDRLFREKASWPELIKQIRAATGANILTAETIALSHDGWRRLCNYRINHEPDCKRHAIRHIKYHGPNSLISAVGGSFVVAQDSDKSGRTRPAE
jgi:hypothetical protein